MSKPEENALSSTVSLTAGIVIIGDEILSGRTRDTNSGTIAARLTESGIDLCEVRVVPDDEAMIIEAVQTLSGRYTYVFTSGGIGPTHDDITADCVAKAFDVGIDINDEARAMLRTNYARDEDLTPARLRMARIPFGARLIPNPLSKAPGFIIGNVHVMAGVPKIMEVMLEHVLSTLPTGVRMESVSVECPVGEGLVATDLGDLQKTYPAVTIGSYPYFEANRIGTKLVARARDLALLAEVEAELKALVERHLAAKEGRIFIG